MRRNAAIVGGLVVITLALYARVGWYDFISFDDGAYVATNPRVSAGLTLDSIHWAFTTTTMADWHPLLWLSFMLDASLFGIRPGPMHLENVLMHAVNAVLVWRLLVKMTYRPWASAWVAAMFAWHPLHVESVAWISERKDVLSTLFMLGCLLVYVDYVRSPSRSYYWLAFALLALGLMTKPMLVTVPVQMLLLDAWPLNRLMDERGNLSLRRAIGLVGEKLPFLVLIMASAVVTIWSLHAARSILSTNEVSLGLRLANAVTAYMIYLSKTFWPAALAIYYPHPGALPGRSIPASLVLSSALGLLAVTLGAVGLRRRAPWLLVGWLWYLGTLVPVIGLVQASNFAYADRFTYTAMLGIFIMLAWSAGEMRRQFRPVATWLGALSTVSVLAVSWRQISFWQDRETIMRHAVDVVPNNYFAHFNLGDTYDLRGEHDAAEREYKLALQIKPDDPDPLNNLGLFAAADGHRDQAVSYFERAIAAAPSYAAAYYNFGNLRAGEGETDAAERLYRAALKHDPTLPQPNHRLALLLAQQGKIDQAIDLWRRAIELDPQYAEAHYRLGQALLVISKSREAIDHLRIAARLEADRPDILDTLAWTLATGLHSDAPDAAEALNLARRACQLSNRSDAKFLDTLAAAQARAGQFPDAQKTAREAIELANAQNKSDLAQRIQVRLELYRNAKPYISEGQQ